jgi:hypothetical protein
VWTAAETVVFALGALVLAGILGAAGFVSSDLSHPVAQPDTALRMIQWGAPLIAAAFIAASILGISRYDLTAATPAAAPPPPPPRARSTGVRESDLPRTFPATAATASTGGSSDVELTVAALGDRDGLQAGGRGAYFDRTGGGVEL